MYSPSHFKKLIAVVTVFSFTTSLAFTYKKVDAKTNDTTISSSDVTKLKKSKSLINSTAYDIIRIPETISSGKISTSKKAWTPKIKSDKYRANELIVKFNPNSKSEVTVNDAKASDLMSKMVKNYGAEITSTKSLGFTNAKLFEYKGNKNPEDLANILKSDYPSSFMYVEPNYVIQGYDIKSDWVPTDPYYKDLWGLKNSGQSVNGQTGTPGIDVNAEKAWDITKGSTSIVVAIIDSGVDASHPDLKNNIWVNTKEIPNNYIDDDNNGYIDDISGWDFYNYDNDPMDYNGHGTHVAGTIAASSDSSGVVGVAPNVKIMPLRFLNASGNGYTSDAVLAVDYSQKMGIKISNNSWGGTVYSQALYDAIKNYQGLFIAAAGNDGVDNDYSPHYPSSYDLPNILSVAAIDNRGSLPYFSNYGAQSVDVAAPGVDIYSCAPYSSYQYLSGTSMATPHVSGVAALALSKNPSWTATTLKSSITKSVVKLSSLTGKVVTGGMVNAVGAIGTTSDNEIPGVPLASTKISGTLNSTNDLDDVYSLKLYKGQYLTLTLSGQTGTDFDLYLYAPSAKTVKTNLGMLAYSEKVGTSAETINYLIKEDGTYYIDVYTFAGTGTYTLSYTTYAMLPGSFEDTSNRVVLDGTWTKVNNISCSGGTYTSTNTNESSIYGRFYGTGIDLTSIKSSTQGVAKVTIDKTVYYVDLYSPTTIYKSTVFTKTGLTKGTHTFKIEWTGMPSRYSRKSSNNTNINFDKITIY